MYKNVVIYCEGLWEQGSEKTCLSLFVRLQCQPDYRADQ